MKSRVQLSGEALYYLGRCYQLKVRDQNGSGAGVKLPLIRILLGFA